MSACGYTAYEAAALARDELREFVWSGEGGVFTNLVFLVDERAT